MQKLVDCKNFTEECIKQYTTENICYIFNKALRNFEKYYLEMAHFIGPFYYGIYLYTINHPEKQITKKTILYRDIEIDRLDLYSYQFCENDIICFTSFTSTTINENLNFEPSNNAKIVNDNLKDKSFAKMIITYNPTKEDSPQGVDVSNLSFYSGEKEFLLFPFTFLKISKVEIRSGDKDDKHLIHLTIINKGKLFEKGLRKKFAFKLVENGNKIIIDKDNTSSCIDNEKYYKMNFNYIDLEGLQSINSIKKDYLDTNNNNPDSSININPINNPINDPINNPINNPMNNPMNNPANNPLYNPMNYPFYSPINNQFYYPFGNPMNYPFYNPCYSPINNPLYNPFYNQVNNPFYNPMNNPFNYYYFYSMLQANLSQNMMNMMVSNKNNENKNPQEKKLPENNNNLYLNTEPTRKIIFTNREGLKEEIIIPINKTLKDLFIIYSGNVGIGVDNFRFIFNAAVMKNNDQSLISELFPYDGATIHVLKNVNV